MLVDDKFVAVSIFQIIGKPTDLGALATVSTAALKALAHLAPATVAHAQGAVHKGFERHIDSTMNGLDFMQGELASHDQLRESKRLQETSLLGGAQVALCAGMKSYGRQVETQDAHVLHNERIYPRPVKVVDEPLYTGKLIVVDDGIDRCIDASPILVSKLGYTCYIAGRISCRGTGPEAGRPHIDGIGAMNNGFDRYIGIASRRQQLNFAQFCFHNSAQK